MLSATMHDLRFALRQFRRAPGFAATSVLTLALAIGCATAVFSVTDATLIRPLPYREPDRIVTLHTYSPQGYGQPASWGQYQDWRRGATAFSALAGSDTGTANLQMGERALPVFVVYGTDNFFDVFGVKPLLGRTFLPGEDQPGHNDVIVLSYGLWREAFGARPEVVGSTVRVDGVPNTVVGVMPPPFRFPLTESEAIFRPLHLSRSRMENRGSHFLPVIGRLKPGVSVGAGQANLQEVFAAVGRAYPDEAGRKVRVQTMAEATLGDTKPALHSLIYAVLGVLLIGCVNVAGLSLARGVHRQRELSLRAAIGANRGRIARQVLTETALLGLAGAAGGVLLAAALLHAIRQLLVHALARGAEAGLNWTVLAGAVLLAGMCTLAAGTYPALRMSRAAPGEGLRNGGSAGTSRAQNRLRGAFLAVQVALALCLLVCSGLLLRNLRLLVNKDLGFSADQMLVAPIYVSGESYRGRSLLADLYRPLLDRVRAIPGVTGAGVIDLVPVLTYGSNSDIAIVGKPPAPPHEERLAENRVVAPGTLEVIGARLVAGRTLNDALDRAGLPLHAVVNEAFVRKFFDPGENAVGREIQWGPQRVAIVGVMTDLRQSLYQPPLAEMDLFAAQIPPEYAQEELTSMNLVVRTAVRPESVVPELRAALHATDASVPFREPQTMRGVIAETLTFERLESWLFGIFAALALTLSLVGIYGTISHEVELRTREIGVRMALGSTRMRVGAEIVRRVAAVMLCGLGAGWLLTLALRTVLASVLELHARENGGLLLGLTALLGGCGVAAGLWPARRASSIEPTEALRAE